VAQVFSDETRSRSFHRVSRHRRSVHTDDHHKNWQRKKRRKDEKKDKKKPYTLEQKRITLKVVNARQRRRIS
jgi:hypothetical protein